MKKVLCILFGIMTFVSTGYSDNLSVVTDVYETSKTIHIKAILEAFKDTQNKCNLINTDAKNQISNDLSSLVLNTHANITVKKIQELCVSATKQAILCFDCLDAIIVKHNNIVRIKTTPNTKYTSKAQYEKELQLRGECTIDNAKSKEFRVSCMNDRREDCGDVYANCKKIAIQHACHLEKLYAYNDGERITYECGPGTLLKYRHAEITDFEHVFYPTWEDYKKLYNIK